MNKARAGDFLDHNICRWCMRMLVLRAGIGWMHEPETARTSLFCDRPEPGAVQCAWCLFIVCATFNRTGVARTVLHRDGDMWCEGSNREGLAPLDEADAFA